MGAPIPFEFARVVLPTRGDVTTSFQVFAPDHLELVKGPAGVRRAHLDDLVAALWPARRSTRASYTRALAQRNSLLGRVRAGHAPQSDRTATIVSMVRATAARAARPVADAETVLEAAVA